MQTTAISVVSDVQGLKKLESIQQAIESHEGYYTVDMTSDVQLKEGVYPDCIVAKTAPILLPPDPMVPLPRCLQSAISSQAFHVISVVVVLLATPFFPGSLLFADKATRQLSFIVSLSTMILVYSLHVCMFRGRILLLVLKTFDFWYLTGFQAVACLSGGYLYYNAGVSLGVVITMFVLYLVSHSLFAFCLDASPYTTKTRAVLMLFWAVSYTVIVVAARFAEHLYSDKNIYDDFVNIKINLIAAEMTPRQGMIATLVTVILFFIKYAVLMFWDTEFVTVWFEAKRTTDRVGAVQKDKLGRKATMFRLNNSVLSRENTAAEYGEENVTDAFPHGKAGVVFPSFAKYSNFHLLKKMDRVLSSGEFSSAGVFQQNDGDDSMVELSSPRGVHFEGGQREGGRGPGVFHVPPAASAVSPSRGRAGGGGGRSNGVALGSQGPLAYSSDTFGPLRSSMNTSGIGSGVLSPNDTKPRERDDNDFGATSSPEGNSMRVESICSNDLDENKL